jgi:hypothetical protein
MSKAQERWKLFKSGGPTVIKKFIKEHQLSKHTPVEVIVELTNRPEFEKNGVYFDEYKHDLMVRQMAASEVRAKYGAKGERRKK